jgi:magnesium-transporting ATPase (P-type)
LKSLQNSNIKLRFFVLEGFQVIVLTILVGLALIFAALVAGAKFNAHCEARFGHKFFTRNAFFCLLITFAFVMIGGSIYHEAAISGGDKLNGVLLIAVGVVIAVVLAFINFRRTDAVYGIGGTVIQFVVLGALAYIAVPLLIMFFVLSILFAAAPRYVVVRRFW